MWKHRRTRRSKDLAAKEIAVLMEAAQVSAEDIQRWHEDFYSHYPSGRLDKKAFVEYSKKLCPNLREQMPQLETIFDQIDANKDGTVDFNELLVVIVLFSRLNDLESRLSFAFDMWDGSDNGYIEREELAEVLSALYDRAGITDRKGQRDPKKRADEIIRKLDLSGDRRLSKEEFISGCKNDPIICNLLAPHA